MIKDESCIVRLFCYSLGAAHVLLGCHGSNAVSRVAEPVLAVDANNAHNGVAFRFRRCGEDEVAHSAHTVVVEELIAGEWRTICDASALDGAPLGTGEWLYGFASRLKCPILVPGRWYRISAAGGGWGTQRFVLSDGRVKFLDVPCR